MAAALQLAPEREVAETSFFDVTPRHNRHMSRRESQQSLEEACDAVSAISTATHSGPASGPMTATISSGGPTTPGGASAVSGGAIKHARTKSAGKAGHRVTFSDAHLCVAAATRPPMAAEVHPARSGPTTAPPPSTIVTVQSSVDSRCEVRPAAALVGPTKIIYREEDDEVDESLPQGTDGNDDDDDVGDEGATEADRMCESASGRKGSLASTGASSARWWTSRHVVGAAILFGLWVALGVVMAVLSTTATYAFCSTPLTAWAQAYAGIAFFCALLLVVAATVAAARARGCRCGCRRAATPVSSSARPTLSLTPSSSAGLSPEGGRNLPLWLSVPIGAFIAMSTILSAFTGLELLTTDPNAAPGNSCAQDYYARAVAAVMLSWCIVTFVCAVAVLLVQCCRCRKDGASSSSSASSPALSVRSLVFPSADRHATKKTHRRHPSSSYGAGAPSIAMGAGRRILVAGEHDADDEAVRPRRLSQIDSDDTVTLAAAARRVADTRRKAAAAAAAGGAPAAGEGEGSRRPHHTRSGLSSAVLNAALFGTGVIVSAAKASAHSLRRAVSGAARVVRSTSSEVAHRTGLVSPSRSGGAGAGAGNDAAKSTAGGAFQATHQTMDFRRDSQHDVAGIDLDGEDSSHATAASVGGGAAGHSQHSRALSAQCSTVKTRATSATGEVARDEVVLDLRSDCGATDDAGSTQQPLQQHCRTSSAPAIARSARRHIAAAHRTCESMVPGLGSVRQFTGIADDNDLDGAPSGGDALSSSSRSSTASSVGHVHTASFSNFTRGAAVFASDAQLHQQQQQQQQRSAAALPATAGSGSSAAADGAVKPASGSAAAAELLAGLAHDGGDDAIDDGMPEFDINGEPERTV